MNKDQKAIRKQMCEILPFVHAFSGCDTTSSLYGIRKVKPFKMIAHSEELENEIKLFNMTDSNNDELGEIGEKLILSVYHSSPYIKNIDDLRYTFTVTGNYFTVERLPPTSRTAYYHSMRSYLQTLSWHF